MGIYDRDYVRQGPRGPGSNLALTMRGLSVVKWLVIINVVVFMLDALVPLNSWVPVRMDDYFRSDVDPSQIDWIRTPPPDQRPPNALGVRTPIIDRATNIDVGYTQYVWMSPLRAIGHFSTSKGFFGLQVWRFVTFQFLHADINHLLFNMIGLWFFGPIVENYLRSPRRFLAFYLLCGIFGALLYLMLNLLGTLIPAQLPLLLIQEPSVPLIGASAGVFGVLMACARVAGNAVMLLFFILPLKISTGAYLLFGVAVLNLFMGGSNAGGDAAHIGGALAGLYFITHPGQLHTFFDVLKNRSPSMPRRAKPVPQASQRAKWRPKAIKTTDEQIDAILDKVSKEGVHSLSEREKKLLEQASRERRGE